MSYEIFPCKTHNIASTRPNMTTNWTWEAFTKVVFIADPLDCIILRGFCCCGHPLYVQSILTYLIFSIQSAYRAQEVFCFLSYLNPFKPPSSPFWSSNFKNPVKALFSPVCMIKDRGKGFYNSKSIELYITVWKLDTPTHTLTHTKPFSNLSPWSWVGLLCPAETDESFSS